MMNSVSSGPSSSTVVGSCFGAGARDRRPPRRMLAFLANPAPDMMAESSLPVADGDAAIEGIKPANDLALVCSDALLDNEEVEEVVIVGGETFSERAVRKRELRVSGATEVRLVLLRGRYVGLRLWQLLRSSMFGK